MGDLISSMIFIKFYLSLLASCPQAASISFPLDFRIVTGILFFSKATIYLSIMLSLAELKRLFSVELYSIRLTFEGENLQKSTKALICSSSS